MGEANIIDVSNLTAGYGDEIILNDVSFAVPEGQILAILGGSGSGKTTLLRHMIGLARPQSGQIEIDGVDITACDDKAFWQTLRKIGILFQSCALFGSMTLAENVALPIVEYAGLPKTFVDKLVRVKLAKFDLAAYENYLPSQISGGMKKRAGLARALALNPKILFLDEPSAGLDPITAAEIDDLILHVNQSAGTTMVIITHELASIFRIAQRVIMLDKGTKGIVADGNPMYLKEHSPNPFVRRFFNRSSEPANVTKD